MQLSWQDNMLQIAAEGVPGSPLEVWYLEAYCRSGSTNREWRETTIPHRTELVSASADEQRIELLCHVEGGVEVRHEITAVPDGVEFRVHAVNRGAEHVDAVWVQPCPRVGAFSGRGQEDYIERSFIFVRGETVFLDQTRRREEARYRGGQVYVPPGIDLDDVNPRPVSQDVPSNGLIGCVSADDEWVMATAWEPCQELFQGVIVCLHSDFRLGGLEPGEEREARGKLYLVRGSIDDVRLRYEADFPEQAARQRASAEELGEHPLEEVRRAQGRHSP